MLAAASAHLSSRDQPDTLTAHLEYPSRTAAGPAIVVVEDIKLGGQLSTLHMTLWQGGLITHAPWITPNVSRRIVLASTTHTNLRKFEGISMPTGYEVSQAAALPSPPDFEALKDRGTDGTWEESTLPKMASFMRSLGNWHFYMVRKPVMPGVVDMWVRMASGERITQGGLAYVVDSFPYNLHVFLVAPELRELMEAPQGGEGGRRGSPGKKAKDDQRAKLWFPTVVMNLEVKAALPEEGVEWLAVRVTSKQIRNGRFDLEVSVRDPEGELVALSHHVAMILSMERNVRKAKPSL